MRYIIGVWMTFHVSMSEDSARRIVKKVQAIDPALLVVKRGDGARGEKLKNEGGEEATTT